MKQSLSRTAAWCVTWYNLSRGDLTILIMSLNMFLPSGQVIPLTGIGTKKIRRAQMFWCRIVYNCKELEAT